VNLVLRLIALMICYVPNLSFAEVEPPLEASSISKQIEEIPELPSDNLVEFPSENEVGGFGNEGEALGEISFEQEDELALTQLELRAGRLPMLSLNLGPVYPWHDLGTSLNWWDQAGVAVWGLSFGVGNYELSEVRLGRALFMDAQIKSAWLSYRRHIREYAFFWEVYSGLEYWHAELRPRTNEQQLVLEAASLISDFSGMAIAPGIKIGFTWHWDNGFFLEYAIMHGRFARLLSEKYTNNTSLARGMTRDQIETFRSWGGVNLKIGMSLR